MAQTMNNLFDFAPSELSQDAILCWLINWADETFSDNKEMHRIGRSFLDDLINCWNKFASTSITLPDKLAINILKQANETDITIFVNTDVVICIEDKTGTSHHSNQLTRCRQSVLDNPDYISMQHVFIFFKTFDFIPDQYLRDSGFSIYNRDNLVDFFSKINISANDILENYAEYILELDSRGRSFSKEPTDLWSWDAILRFHSEIAKRNPGMEGRYVPNAAGGFLGCWGSQIYIPEEMCVYLQVQTCPATPVNSKLYFKISELEKPEDTQKVRECWYDSLITAAAKFQIVLEKTRWRIGETMAVAAMPDDFRIIGRDGRIDMDKTLEKWRLAQSILKEAAKVYIASRHHS